MRASLRSFLSLLQPRALVAAKEEDSWLSDLDKSGWMDHLRKLLHTSAHVAHIIAVERGSVLVHCSYGWDCTSQVTALAQLMLDPAFRTRAGFQRLIVKEWLSFGHQIALRSGTIAPLEKSSHAPSDEECAPIFLQFVDCVWQLSQQMPRAFEFNQTYLAHLLHHLMACEHGTFLCNCERQRVQLGLPELTTSAWDALSGPEYTNHDFLPNDASILVPNLAACALRPWTAFYCRASELLLSEPSTLLEAKVAALQKEKAELTRLLELARAGQPPFPSPAPPTPAASAELRPLPPEPSPVDVSDDAEVAALAEAAATAAADATAVAAAAAESQELEQEAEEEEVFESVRASIGRHPMSD